MDGGDGSGRNVAAFLLQKEVQFALVIRVRLVALTGVIELSGTQGAERAPAGGVQRPPAGGQGAQAAPRRHGQGAGREAEGRGALAVKTGMTQKPKHDAHRLLRTPEGRNPVAPNSIMMAGGGGGKITRYYDITYCHADA